MLEEMLSDIFKFEGKNWFHFPFRALFFIEKIKKENSEKAKA